MQHSTSEVSEKEGLEAAEGPGGNAEPEWSQPGGPESWAEGLPSVGSNWRAWRRNAGTFRGGPGGTPWRSCEETVPAVTAGGSGGGGPKAALKGVSGGVMKIRYETAKNDDPQLSVQRRFNKVDLSFRRLKGRPDVRQLGVMVQRPNAVLNYTSVSYSHKP
ncbi:unnamed protein product [Boreogadus saida]